MGLSDNSGIITPLNDLNSLPLKEVPIEQEKRKRKDR